MLIRQHSTFADELLLKVLCPYLNAHGARWPLALAHLWNEELFTAQTSDAPRPATGLRSTWKRLAEIVSPAITKVSVR